MSHTNKKFIITYVLLVGLPIAGLVGILKRGYRLVAPVSVDGNWKLVIDTRRLATLLCLNSVSPVSDASVAISQSGKELVFNLNTDPRPVATGSITGNVIKASVLPSLEESKGQSCASDRRISMSAMVDSKADPKAMSGSLSSDGCSFCPPVQFHAVQQARTPRNGSY